MNITTLELDIYDSDTVRSLFDRLSLNSLPKFICIKGVFSAGGVEIAKNISNDTLPIIKKQARISVRLIDLYKRVLDLETDYFLNFFETYESEIEELKVFVDLFFVWSYKFLLSKGYAQEYTRSFAELEYDTATKYIKDALQGKLDLDVKVSNFPNYNTTEATTIESYYKSLQQSIKEHDTFVERNIKALEKQKGIEGVATTDFSVEKKRVLCQTDITNVSLYEVFNWIVLTSKFPFASFDNFYKVLKAYNIRKDWINTSKDKILIKFVDSVGADPIDIYFFIEKGALYISYEFEPSGMLNDEHIKTLLHDITPENDYNIVNTEFLDLSGVFYIPDATIQPYILAHLVLINSEFSNFFIDESSKTTKTKSGMYMYFNYAGEMISFVVTPKRREESYEKDIPPEIKTGSNYIRVKVSNVKTDRSRIALMNAFSKIVTLYNEHKYTVQALYTPYIPNISSIAAKPIVLSKEIKTLSTKVDRVLIPPGSNYKRSCIDFHPVIINPDEVDKYKEEYGDRSVAMYPKQDDQSSLTKRYYACPYTDETNPANNAPYLGLLKLKTVNHYVPCCYKMPENKLYEEYYGIDTGKKRRQQYVISKGIPMDRLKFGDLSAFPEIQNIVKISDDVNVERTGVDISNLSFLQCILDAKSTPYSKKDTSKSRIEGVKNELARLVGDDKVLQIAKQCLFDKSTDDIKKMLTSDLFDKFTDALTFKDAFLDPIFFKQLFEEIYDCHIIVFNQTGIELCRTAKTLIPLKPKKEVIMILVIEVKSGYPRCERLTHRIKTSKEPKGTFSTEICVPYILNAERRMIDSFIGNQNIISDSLNKDVFSQQIINSFGKTAAYITKKGRYFIYLDAPCVPTDTPVGTRFNVYDVKKTIDDIRKIFLIQDTKQIIAGNVIEALEFTTTLGIVFFVPVNHTPIVPDLQISTRKIIIPRFPGSVINKFTYNQKIARYLREFMYFMFSEYVNKKSITSLDINIIERFVKECIVVDEKFEYKISTSKTFGGENEKVFLTGDRKLKVQSNELLKRLVFCLRVEIVQRHQEIFEYYKRTHIENFIVDINDFDQHRRQIILDGREAFTQYIDQKSSVHPIVHRVLPTTKETYFFSNVLIDDEIYIAKNADNLDDVVSVIAHFRENGVISDTPGIRTAVYADVYEYFSEIEIVKSSDQDVINNNYKLLTYNYDGEQYYTVLIKL